jgi:hypothetical protein
MLRAKLTRCDKHALVVLFVAWIAFAIIFTEVNGKLWFALALSFPFGFAFALTYAGGYHAGYEEAMDKQERKRNF